MCKRGGKKWRKKSVEIQRFFKIKSEWTIKNKFRIKLNWIENQLEFKKWFKSNQLV